jgi:hypothetical protein
MGQQSSNRLLLTTKLAVPPIRSDLVLRPRLFNKLETCLDHPLTLLAADEAAERTGNVIAVLALQALAYRQRGNAEQAMRVLNRLLLLAEPEGYMRVFVDEGPYQGHLRQARGPQPYTGDCSCP